MPCAEGRNPDSIDACEGSVVDGMMVWACHVNAPTLARPVRVGAAWMSASGRSPSIETITTRGGVGEAAGPGTAAVGWLAECPHAIKIAASETAAHTSAHRLLDRFSSWPATSPPGSWRSAEDSTAPARPAYEGAK